MLVCGAFIFLLPLGEQAGLAAWMVTVVVGRELIITGTVSREHGALSAVRSLAMLAKLFGLRFWLNEGILQNLQPTEHAVNS